VIVVGLKLGELASSLSASKELSMSRKYDYKTDTSNGKDLMGFTSEEILQAGWYALQMRAEQNDKQTAVRKFLKNDPRAKSLIEQARASVKKASSK
jgi:hypothetical protein